ncbi:LamG-like jellyroll fold domain-containing protein [Alienimonas chondri]|uniref:LamG-like jellyroll fold domain-containing protein n=1 Tax=Alienimonas chondri TaxID=2681879 RepID=A0ABX1VF37_9PLAN|nr:LamG-like jellyroll fold domain-containing protein [Alienimonas chondri]NNJ26344.1 hypothetical protein [Alienimonas chondri]
MADSTRPADSPGAAGVSAEVRRRCLAAADGTISDEGFAALQDALRHDPAAVEYYLRASRMTHVLEEIAAERATDAVSPAPLTKTVAGSPRRRVAGWAALAGATLLAIPLAFFLWHDGEPAGEGAGIAAAASAGDGPEETVVGHATLRRAVDVVWAKGAPSYRGGALLPAGPVAFDAGLVEIDFFCGATVVVEGPAALTIDSDWAARVMRGRLRADVPPAARGFTVRTAETEVLDLGTAFALDVSPDGTFAEVLDGEVELRSSSGEAAETRLTTGQSRWLGEGTAPAGGGSWPGAADLEAKRVSETRRRFGEWKAAAAQRAGDAGLLAYYPIAAGGFDRVLPNEAAADGPPAAAGDGALVGMVAAVDGRFGAESAGLSFERPGSRVRTVLDGEFPALSLSCWVRIDGLDRRYNALFMADGYENGEPHWQIRDDGRLMFSVMVDDSAVVEHFSELEGRVVRDAGLHRIYLTPPIWDLSKSGRWFHLASVYDPAAGRVRQYVDGELVADETIQEKFLVESLRIGPAEIGNWGQPFRQSPAFALRNLNGVIDELAVYRSPLSGDDVRRLYDAGKPSDH